ncbi:MAG: hypothetical protein JNK38_09195 [Acidobacteria bacterium]|nr:hypothetical protein [Acidobacteriota bacterium]
MKSRTFTSRSLAAFLLTAALVFSGSFTTSTLAVAAPKTDNQVVGQLNVVGAATINDKKAITGTTVFSNSRVGVACAGGNRATVNLGKLGRVELAPGSQMVLKFTDGMISGDLVMGKIVVNAPVGVKVAINTPEGVSASDGKEASMLAVATQRGVRCVPVVTSQSSSTTALSSGALAAILLGAGGAAVAGAAFSSQQASSTNP